MRRLVRQVKVKNAKGERYIVSEIEHVETVGEGRTRKLIEFATDSGQSGTFIDANTFQLADSGELLTRIRRVKSRD